MANMESREVIWGYDNKVRQNPQSEGIYLRNIGFTRRLAKLTGSDYGGTISPSDLYSDGLPSSDGRERSWFAFATLSIDDALRLGAISDELARFIEDESISPSKAREIFRQAPHLTPHLIAGGVADSLVESKAITHGLIGPEASVPWLWTPEVNSVAESLQAFTLPGHTGFTEEDLRKGTAWLLNQYQDSAARLKNAKGSGGEGQAVIENMGSFDAAFGKIQTHLDKQALLLKDVGAVVELDLNNPYALSFGQFYHQGVLLSFVGVIYDYEIDGSTHFLGSNKFYYPGDWQDLINHVALPPKVVDAMKQVPHYEDALMKKKGILALRTNYNWLLGQRNGAVEHTLRGGGSSLIDFLEWNQSQDHPDSASLAASRQIYSFDDKIVRLTPAHNKTEKLIYAYRIPRTPLEEAIQARQPKLETVYAVEHTRDPKILENEEIVNDVLLGDKDERVVFIRRYR